MAHWLDTVCRPLDHAVFAAIHRFAMAAGDFFTPLMSVITTLGDGGIAFILLGILLLLFRRTRKLGLAVLASIAVGAVFTNITLKPLVARPRPFADEAHIFHTWWQEIGAHPESSFSFPSGHTTSATAAMTAIFLHCNKKYSWSALLFAPLMGFTRLYFMVHYPTDVLAGLLCGAVAAVVAYFLVRGIWYLLHRFEDRAPFRLALEFDLYVTVRRLQQRISSRHGEKEEKKDCGCEQKEEEK